MTGAAPDGTQCLRGSLLTCLSTGAQPEGQRVAPNIRVCAPAGAVTECLYLSYAGPFPAPECRAESVRVPPHVFLCFNSRGVVNCRRDAQCRLSHMLQCAESVILMTFDGFARVRIGFQAFCAPDYSEQYPPGLPEIHS